jgi:hypothetical protein
MVLAFLMTSLHVLLRKFRGRRNTTGWDRHGYLKPRTWPPVYPQVLDGSEFSTSAICLGLNDGLAQRLPRRGVARIGDLAFADAAPSSRLPSQLVQGTVPGSGRQRRQHTFEVPISRDPR